MLYKLNLIIDSFLEQLNVSLHQCRCECLVVRQSHKIFASTRHIFVDWTLLTIYSAAPQTLSNTCQQFSSFTKGMLPHKKHFCLSHSFPVKCVENAARQTVSCVRTFCSHLQPVFNINRFLAALQSPNAINVKNRSLYFFIYLFWCFFYFILFKGLIIRTCLKNIFSSFHKWLFMNLSFILNQSGNRKW